MSNVKQIGIFFPVLKLSLFFNGFMTCLFLCQKFDPFERKKNVWTKNNVSVEKNNVSVEKKNVWTKKIMFRLKLPRFFLSFAIGQLERAMFKFWLKHQLSFVEKSWKTNQPKIATFCCNLTKICKPFFTFFYEIQ